jgi:flagellar FliL protein
MAAPKAEAHSAPPAKNEASAAPAPGAGKSEAVASSAPLAARSALTSWLPAVAAILLAPVATWAAVEFVVLPRLQKKIAAMPAAETSAAEPAASGADKGGAKLDKDGKAIPTASAEMKDVVVNLAGTMGTRYLKTSFIVTGAKDVDIKAVFEGAKPRLTDVTLNVLSSLTLADLDEPGAKNVIREKLVTAYNQALNKKVADQVYFSDFVIQ